MDAATSFQEAGLGETPLRKLGLRIAGTPLEQMLADFGAELDAVGLRRVRPRYYLSTEWGEWSQEQDGSGGRALLHLARLLREPGRYRAEFGDAAYDVMLGDCRWRVYRTIGKLGARIDVLRKP